MWERMQLLPEYWCYMITIVLVYSVLAAIFDEIRSKGAKCRGNGLNNRGEHPNQTKEGHLPASTVADHDEYNGMTPATFPNDKHHIPNYISNEIPEVRLKYQSYYN